MEYMEVLIKILGKNYHKQKAKNKKKILEKLADNEVYNI